MKNHSELSRTVRPRANVLGIGVDAVNLSTAVDRILRAAENQTRGYVCVTGVHGVIESQRDPDLRRIHNESLMTVPDGMPTVWVGRAQGHRGMERVPGPELMLAVCNASRSRGVTHYLYGGIPGVADQLKHELSRRFPGIRVLGTYTPPFRPLNPDEEAALFEELDRLKPDILWIGLSTPKQERFMAAYIDRLPVKVMIGVGAAYDMHTGRTRRAPRWLGGIGMEWCFRLMTEPRRLWRRYARNNPEFVWRIALQAAGVRRIPLNQE